MTHEEKLERLEDIKALRRDRKSLDLIGRLSGISRERVRQILARDAPELDGKTYRASKPVRPAVEKTCAHCNKRFSVPYKLRNRKGCSRACGNEMRRVYPEKNPHVPHTPEWSHFKYELVKKYQPEKIRLYRETGYRNFKRRLQDPAFRAWQKEYHAAWARRRTKEHPEEARARNKKQWLRIKGDPVRYRAIRVGARLRYYRRLGRRVPPRKKA